ncbi:MAG: DUF2861 family protein [Collimonas pratensis]|uniref:DUF2861 family protein n=1 Tax=Collimonas pratensis TaxID=279113 RepID=UPI003C7145C7
MNTVFNRWSHAALALVLLCCLGAASAALPLTPLQPVYHALLREQAGTAWQQLINLWPSLNSDAQRQAWLAALAALVARQCGNDLPVATPSWLDSPTLDLVQRDIPLNRIYRVQLHGQTNRRDVRITLDLPDGERLLDRAAPSYDSNGEFMVESKELGKPLPPGVYQLTFASGGETWSQALALHGSATLTVFEHAGRAGALQMPPHAAACPAPWVEQALLKRPDFAMVWWRRVATPEHLQWPQRADAEQLWTNVSVIRAEARGGLTIRTEHRLGGPLVRQEK